MGFQADLLSAAGPLCASVSVHLLQSCLGGFLGLFQEVVRDLQSGSTHSLFTFLPLPPFVRVHCSTEEQACEKGLGQGKHQPSGAGGRIPRRPSSFPARMPYPWPRRVCHRCCHNATENALRTPLYGPISLSLSLIYFYTLKRVRQIIGFL